MSAIDICIILKIDFETFGISIETEVEIYHKVLQEITLNEWVNNLIYNDNTLWGVNNGKQRKLKTSVFWINV